MTKAMKVEGPLHVVCQCDKCKTEKQEPVAWMDADGNVSDNNDHKCFPIPLYTHPPQRTEQEPVAWRMPNWSNLHGKYGYRDFDDPVCDIDGKPSSKNEPLYTYPPKRTWVGLTDEEQQQAYEQWQNDGWGVFYNAIEAKLKDKNCVG